MSTISDIEQKHVDTGDRNMLSDKQTETIDQIGCSS